MLLVVRTILGIKVPTVDLAEIWEPGVPKPHARDLRLFPNLEPSGPTGRDLRYSNRLGVMNLGLVDKWPSFFTLAIVPAEAVSNVT